MKARLKKVSPGIYSVSPQYRWKSFLSVKGRREEWPIKGRKVATNMIKPGLLEVNIPESADRFRIWKAASSIEEKKQKRHKN
jgi:hypothetical protein